MDGTHTLTSIIWKFHKTGSRHSGDTARRRFRGPNPTRRYRANNVILAIGKLGNPRHLTIPGAESEHVEYRLKDPR